MLPKEAEVSLTDFFYVQALYDNLVKTHSVSESQKLLTVALSSDRNKAAVKVYEYYLELISGGKSEAETYKTIGLDFNLKLSIK